jgi:type II secretory pathway component GspD/PulD (secretin)
VLLSMKCQTRFYRIVKESVDSSARVVYLLFCTGTRRSCSEDRLHLRAGDVRSRAIVTTRETLMASGTVSHRDVKHSHKQKWGSERVSIIKSRLGVLLLCGALWGSFVTADARGQPADREPPRVDHLFFQTDLREAIADISTQAGVPIVIGDTVEGIVSLELRDTPLPTALDMLLAPGAYVWRQKNGYILVGPGDVGSPLFLELSDTRELRLSHLTAEQAIAMLSPRQQEFVSAAEGGNRLAITAPTNTLERIVANIRRLDQPSRHVLLEARVVSLERGASLDLGIEWDFPTIRTGSVVGAGLREGRVDGNWQVSVGLTPGLEFTNSLNMALNLMQLNREATIVAQPQLMVRSGQPARMGVTTEERFEVRTGGAFDRVELDTVTSGTILMIEPIIGEDNKITLNMDIEISNVVGRRQNDLPIITRRTANSTVNIASGGTAAIAGLVDNRTDSLDRRVPGFGGLPLFGALFQNDLTRRDTAQLAIFITATIVEAERPRLPERRSRPYQPVDEEAFRQAIRQVMERLQLDERSQQGVQP